MNNRMRQIYKWQLKASRNDPLVIGVIFPKDRGPFGVHIAIRKSEMAKYEKEYGAKFYMKFEI